VDMTGYYLKSTEKGYRSFVLDSATTSVVERNSKDCPSGLEKPVQPTLERVKSGGKNAVKCSRTPPNRKAGWSLRISYFIGDCRIGAS
jgi:hypothetical protein